MAYLKIGDELKQDLRLDVCRVVRAEDYKLLTDSTKRFCKKRQRRSTQTAILS